MTNSSAAERWAAALDAWAIPKEILNQAPESPWIHPPVHFQVPDVIELTPSHRVALEAIPLGGSVLDIGCGGGVAAFALTPAAPHVIGVDHQSEMLEMFRENARNRGLECTTIEGFWPAIAAEVPMADVVTVHHVVYNVREIRAFIEELNKHSTKRVVLELPQQHPLSDLSPLWRRFWNIERPTSPTPSDLMAVLTEMGIDAHYELWEGKIRVEQNVEDQTRFVRIRLCLPATRDYELRALLAEVPRPNVRPLATIWWDVP